MPLSLFTLMARDAIRVCGVGCGCDGNAKWLTVSTMHHDQVETSGMCLCSIIHRLLAGLVVDLLLLLL